MAGVEFQENNVCSRKIYRASGAASCGSTGRAPGTAYGGTIATVSTVSGRSGVAAAGVECKLFYLSVGSG
jgi:hypothetical protein